MGSAARPETGEADTRLDERVCLDEGFYLHRQGTAGVSSQIMTAPVRGRSSGPIQPAAGISARSTETICGPKLSPPAVPAATEQAQETRIIAGQWRWRWDLNPRKTCAFTRFRVLRITVHRRPPSSVACANTIRAATGERWRTGVNETKTEPRAWCRGRSRPARTLASAQDCRPGLSPRWLSASSAPGKGSGNPPDRWLDDAWACR